MEILRSFGSVPVTTGVLKSMMTDYSNPNAKIKLWIEHGYLVPLKRGLYVVSPTLTQQSPCLELMANHIYSPSYVSQQYALRYYGLIPERVYMVTNVTTRHARDFKNAFGTFTYHNVGMKYFPLGIVSKSDNGGTYLIASPEKALVDTILYTNYVPNSLVGLGRFLEEDMRFDMESLCRMDISLLQSIASVAPKQAILQNLITLCQQ